MLVEGSGSPSVHCGPQHCTMSTLTTSDGRKKPATLLAAYPPPQRMTGMQPGHKCSGYVKHISHMYQYQEMRTRDIILTGPKPTAAEEEPYVGMMVRLGVGADGALPSGLRVGTYVLLKNITTSKAARALVPFPHRVSFLATRDTEFEVVPQAEAPEAADIPVKEFADCSMGYACISGGYIMGTPASGVKESSYEVVPTFEVTFRQGLKSAVLKADGEAAHILQQCYAAKKGRAPLGIQLGQPFMLVLNARATMGDDNMLLFRAFKQTQIVINPSMPSAVKQLSGSVVPANDAMVKPFQVDLCAGHHVCRALTEREQYPYDMLVEGKLVHMTLPHITKSCKTCKKSLSMNLVCPSCKDTSGTAHHITAQIRLSSTTGTRTKVLEFKAVLEAVSRLLGFMSATDMFAELVPMPVDEREDTLTALVNSAVGKTYRVFSWKQSNGDVLVASHVQLVQPCNHDVDPVAHGSQSSEQWCTFSEL